MNEAPHFNTDPAIRSGRFPPNCSAFTLIEMLVVIAIIALLASLVTTAVSSALQSARETAGRNAIRTWGNAMLIYATNHKGKLPTADTENGNLGTWQENVADILYDGDGSRFQLRQEHRHPNADPVMWGFGTSAPLALRPMQNRIMYLSQIPNPTQGILVADNKNGALHHLNTTPNRGPDYSRNRGKALFFLADGHVTLLSPEQAAEQVEIIGK